MGWLKKIVTEPSRAISEFGAGSLSTKLGGSGRAVGVGTGGIVGVGCWMVGATADGVGDSVATLGSEQARVTRTRTRTSENRERRLEPRWPLANDRKSIQESPHIGDG